MNYADIRPIDSSNGKGVSTTAFFSGCQFHCKNCFNQVAWDFNYGNEWTKEVEDKFIKYAKNKYVTHVSLLGGEVFHQDLNVILHLVKRIKFEVNKPIWVWTGFTWNTLIQDKNRLEILRYVDVLIDGRFEIDKKRLNLKYKGSLNQNVINVQESLKQNRVIELAE